MIRIIEKFNEDSFHENKLTPVSDNVVLKFVKEYETDIEINGKNNKQTVYIGTVLAIRDDKNAKIHGSDMKIKTGFHVLFVPSTSCHKINIKNKPEYWIIRTKDISLVLEEDKKGKTEDTKGKTKEKTNS